MAIDGSGPPSGATPEVRALRPLSIGEILDRGFSIVFRHFIPFAAIVLVVTGPQLLFTYFGFKDVFSLAFGPLLNMPTTGGQPPQIDPQKMLDAYAQGGPYLAAVIGIALFFVPLSNAAVVSGVSRAYLGMPVRFADCYRDAVKRWLPLVLLVLLWFVAAIGAYIAIVIATFVVALSSVGLFSLLHTVGAVVAGVVIFAAVIALIVFGLMVYLAFAYSFTATTLEGLGPGDGFVSGFRRVFGEGQFRRSFGIACALAGIFIGVSLVVDVLAYLAIFIVHSLVIQIVVQSVIGAFAYPFAFAVVAVSYYDVRIRREGFDLQLLAGQLGSGRAT